MIEANNIAGNHMGIVIANNDPQKKGRVKVYIPYLSPSVYQNWHQTNKDKKFKFLGKNIDSPLSEIVEELKDILPWADCASPIIGECAAGRYNSPNQMSTISDSNCFETSKPQKDFKPTQYSQNSDGVGEKPANIYEKPEHALSDAFVSPAASGTVKANLYGSHYKPASYSNKSKGSFSVPPVGSHVWVFFHMNDPMTPVYFAANHNAEAWQGMFESSDYPASYENKSPSEQSDDDHNEQTYRNKYILNQKGGTFEIINTDNKEAINLTHYSGSFISLTNPTTIYLATANEQHLILGDKFETIRGDDNYYVEGDWNWTVKGSINRQLGTGDASAIQKWKDLMQDVADIKQRFEIQRVDEKGLFNSLQQSKKGTHAPCPVCKGKKKINTLKNEDFKYAKTSCVYIKRYPYSGFSPNKGYYETVNTVDPLNQQPSSGRPRDYLERINFNLYSEVTKYDFVKPEGVFKEGKPQPLEFPATRRCPACQGTGLSPSSMGGTWTIDPAKPQIAQKIVEKASALAKAEADLGQGGHEVLTVIKHKVETIGSVMNDFGSIRVDSKGKMYNTAVYVDELGVYEFQAPSPLIEYVHVDDLPGGNYTMNACNRYTLNVGAGGVSIKTYGPVQIGGTAINMAGEQINIASGNEVNIDGGKRLTLTADIMVLKQRQLKQVMIDSSLGISKNLIVAGGAHVEGELTVNHITAPVEIQETELTKPYGITNDETSKIIGYLAGGQPVYSCIPDMDLYPEENCLYTYPHSHHFRNLPLTLVNNNTELRKYGAKNNAMERNYAVSQDNIKKLEQKNKNYKSDQVNGGTPLS